MGSLPPAAEAGCPPAGIHPDIGDVGPARILLCPGAVFRAQRRMEPEQAGGILKQSPGNGFLHGPLRNGCHAFGSRSAFPVR